MDLNSDELAILTLPHNNDLATINYHTNNCLVLLAIIVQLKLLIGLLIVAYALPHLLHEVSPLPIESLKKSSKLGSAYLYVIIAHLIVYMIVCSLRFILHRWHYKKLRIIGYHNHYNATVWLNKATSWTFHRANGLILLATTLLCHYLEDEGIIPVHFAGLSFNLQPINVLQIIITVAQSFIIPALLKFLWKEIRFRKARSPPDVFCLDNPTHLQQAGLGEIGIRSQNYLEDLLDKQADLIHNLKLQNSHLRLTLHRVTSSQAASASNMGSNRLSASGGGGIY